MKSLDLLLLGTAFAFAPSPALLAQAQLQPLWSVDPGSRPYLTTDNTQRGLAYDPVTGQVLLVNRAGGLSVNALDGVTGADLGTLNVSGISGGTFALNQIAAASDGAIYAANLVTATSGESPFKVYRWANASAVPALVYSGELVAGTRWGDNIEIRGSGNGTQILFGQGGTGVGNRIALFETADNGVTFSPTTMTVTGLSPGDTRGAVAFGPNDTFFTKNAGGVSLYYGTFDLDTGSAGVTSTAALPEGLSGFGPLGTYYDPAVPGGVSLLAGIQVNTAVDPQSPAHQLYLFDATDPADPVTLDIEPLLDPGNRNNFAAGAVDLGGGKLFALDANNGIRAYELIPEPSTGALLGVGIAAVLWGAHRGRRP